MDHVLLLEDIPEIRMWLKNLIQQVFVNARVVECSRVQDALLQVGQQRFELAMIDLGLPDGSGVTVVEALRDKQPEAQSVIVTIHDDDEHLFPALQAGAFGYLLKEQARELLVEQLQRWAVQGGHQVTVVLERPMPLESELVTVVCAPRAAPNSADDEIVRLVRSADTPAGITVVTSDGALSARVHDAGAVTFPAGRFRALLD